MVLKVVGPSHKTDVGGVITGVGTESSLRTAAGATVAELTTHADGTSHFFPSSDGPRAAQDYVASVTCGRATRHAQLRRDGLEG